jgi:heptosyltransferase-2
METIKPEQIKNILVIRKHNQIGDLIVSVPMYFALKKKFPLSKITLLASKTNYPIPFKDIIPQIDEIITFDKSSLKSQFDLIKTLRTKNFDLAIIPSTVRLSSTSNLVGFLSGAKIKVGVRRIDEEKNNFHFLLNIKKDFNWRKNKTHQSLRNIEVVEQIGCKINFNELLSSYSPLTDEEKFEASQFLNDKFSNPNLLIGIHPGAGKKENTWDTLRFIKVVENLYENFQSNFLITAGKTDEEVLNKFIPALKEKNIPYELVINFPYRKLLSLINQCDLFISNDTGVMHMASLTDTILIALMRKNNVFEWAPLFKNKFYLSSPTDEINDLSIDEVINFTQKMIKIIMYKKKLT